MKRIIVTSIFVTLTAGLVAQKTNVPAKVTTAFNAKFPGAKDVKWGKESKTEYEAEFKLNGNGISANFKADGSWTETESVIKVSELPVAVVTAINKKYPGAVISKAEKVEMPGKTAYETSFKLKGKKKSLELNADGSIAK